MDVIHICQAFSRGMQDAVEKKEKVKQDNFNLDEAYNYGYELASEMKIIEGNESSNTH